MAGSRAAGELGALTVATRGTKTALAQVDVDQAWRAVGEEHGLSRARGQALFGEQPRHESRPVGSDLLGVLARDRSMVERRELDARAAELAAGVMRPGQARHIVAELTRSWRAGRAGRRVVDDARAARARAADAQPDRRADDQRDARSA